MPFPQAPAGARRILGGWRRSGWLWCCGRSCCWCSRRMIKRISTAGSCRGRRGPVREGVQSRSAPSEAKPGSLWICEPALSPAATPRVCHRPPDCTRGSPHSSAHQGTLWCWLWLHDMCIGRSPCYYYSFWVFEVESDIHSRYILLIAATCCMKIFLKKCPVSSFGETSFFSLITKSYIE